VLLNNYFKKRREAVEVQEVIYVAMSLNKKSKKMANARLYKHSYKEIEEFRYLLRGVKSSLELSNNYDKSVQLKVVELMDMPINTITDFDVFSKGLFELGVLMSKEIPFFWRTVQLSLSPRIAITGGELVAIFVLLLLLIVLV